jgi:hypothetical protein
MKTLFKVLVIGILLTAFSALTFAQEPDLATLFDKFKTEYKAPCGQRDAALVTGKLIIDKFGSDELNKDVIDVVKKRMKIINDTDPDCKRNARYDAAYKTASKTKNWDDFFAVSKEIIAAKGDSAPISLDVMLTLVSVGYNSASLDKNDKYNADTMSYAKTALQKLDAGQNPEKLGPPPGAYQWGVFEPFKSKENAQSWMNKIIGYLMYEKMNQKKEALTYLYKASQLGTENKGDVSIYVNIGNYYFDEASRYDTLYRDARKANNNVENDETKKLLGLARANADRGIDAFGRASKAATTPAAKTGLNKTLSDLYKFRFNLAPEAKTPDLEKYVADLNSKPMADPASEVTPVVIEEVKPATTPTTPTTTTPTTPTTNKPTTTPTTKKPGMTETTTTTPTTTKPTTKPTTPVKKPVTKKKGTR